MKHAMRFAISLAAAGALLGSVASHATDLAELPLKASVLAKPNVIFGLDDSGSMDSEVLLTGNDGAMWWDSGDASNAGGTGWDASGNLWFNAVGSSSSRWRKLVNLFPNGTGSGSTNDVRMYTDSTNDHFAIPPTAQFAFARSAAYNPLYYDPTVTYAPWSPAYIGTAKVTFPNASTTAARSHPLYPTMTTGTTMDLTSTVSNNVAGKVFVALKGMQLPGTAWACSSLPCKSSDAVSAKGWTETSTGSGVYTASYGNGGKNFLVMDYFPATYYLKESCTVNGSSCVSAPDGATLKRYEIKPANYSTTAAYNTAIQNFANWFTYYRKRKLMLAASMGQVLEPLTGLRMDVVVFNSQSNVTMYDIDSTDNSKNGLKVAGLFYSTNGSGGTPTRETLKYIGDQYLNNVNTIKYACQRNNAFIVTDGFANATSTSPPSYTQDAIQDAGAPYNTIYSGTLADIAMSYYRNTLRSASSFALGKVPATSSDKVVNLHMNTYGLTLGAKGTLYTGTGATAPTTASAWPNPTDDRSPTAVDDLWHATINGRGQMYTAATPTETALRIQAGLNDILSATGAQGGVAVSTVNLSRGDGKAYVGSYNPSGWSGDLTANVINTATGAIATNPTWRASTLLNARNYTTRVIASATASTNGSGVGFTETDVGSVVNASNAWGVTTDVMNYLRGNRSGEGSTFRARTSLIGAVINAEPVIDRDNDVVYVASGEGMLHAFDIKAGTDVGKELWAFVPRANLADMGQTTERGYVFKTQLDGTPVIGKYDSSGSKLLVAGLGAAGRYYYAIDVTTPRTYTESQLATAYKWEFPSSSDSVMQSKVGQTVGKPVVVRLANNSYAVLVTSGYNSTYDGQGRMWMLNPSTGAVINEFVVPAGSLSAESGLAHVAPYAEDDGSVRYVYGGDLLGNVWRFDLTAMSTPTLIAVLKDGSNNLQPVTAAPDLGFVENQRIVVIGTGRLLDITDFGKTATQSIYAIADGSTINPARGSLVAQTYTKASGSTAESISSNAVNWTSKRGWYVDLPSGQQANTRPSIAYGNVAFVTNTTGATDCSASSMFYVLDLGTGSQGAYTTSITQPISTTANSSGLTAVITSTGEARGLAQTGDGLPVEKQIAARPTIDPKKNSWFEVRRE